MSKEISRKDFLKDVITYTVAAAGVSKLAPYANADLTWNPNIPRFNENIHGLLGGFVGPIDYEAFFNRSNLRSLQELWGRSITHKLIEEHATARAELAGEECRDPKDEFFLSSQLRFLTRRPDSFGVPKPYVDVS